MGEATVRSRCECQAQLVATLDAERHVLEGTARRGGATENAPAHSIHASSTTQRFDVGWLCPFCNRNTLRSFEQNAIEARSGS